MTDIHSCSYYCQRPECIKAQRDELRERLAQPEQPEQEPVAWITEWKGVHSSGKVLDFKKHRRGGEVTHWPLYTTPPQRKPLTDEDQIAEALRRHGLTLVKTAKGYDVMNLGQITAHGVKGEE